MATGFDVPDPEPISARRFPQSFVYDSLRRASAPPLSASALPGRRTAASHPPVDLVDILQNLGADLFLDEVPASGGNLEQGCVQRRRAEDIDVVGSQRAAAQVEALGRVLVFLDLSVCLFL